MAPKKGKYTKRKYPKKEPLSIRQNIIGLCTLFNLKVFLATLFIGSAALSGVVFGLYSSSPYISDKSLWPQSTVSFEDTFVENNIEKQPEEPITAPEPSSYEPEPSMDKEEKTPSLDYSDKGESKVEENQHSGYEVDFDYDIPLYQAIDDDIYVPRKASGQTVFEHFKTPLFEHVKQQAHQGLVSLVMVDYGLSTSLTMKALEAFKGMHVNFALSPYLSSNAQAFVDTARGQGKEVWLDLLLQPTEFPWKETGPLTLLLDSPPDENRRRLILLLSQARGVPGLISTQETGYVYSESQMDLLLRALDEHGVAFVESSSKENRLVKAYTKQYKIPYGQNKLWLAANGDIETLDRDLAKIKELAINNGPVVAFFKPKPKLIDKISLWLKSEADDAGLLSVPLSYTLSQK